MLFRQGPERLGEQGDLITGEGQLVGLGAEKLPVHAHDVADVELFEVFVGFLTHEVFGRIALDTAAAIHKMENATLPKERWEMMRPAQVNASFSSSSSVAEQASYSARMAPASCVFTNPLR